MITELDEFMLFSEDGNNYHVLEAARRFKAMPQDARARLRVKWIKQGRIVRQEDTGEDFLPQKR